MRLHKIKIFGLLSMAILLAAATLISCAKKSDDNIIAAVNGKKIDADYLKRSFQLDPKWGRGLTQKQAHENQLNYLIDQKLFALAVNAETIERDASLKKHLAFIEQKELIKELYRQKVAQKIEISDEEYREAYQNSKKEIVLNYVFCQDAEHAAEYVRALGAQKFGELTPIHPADKIGVTPPFRLGDMDENIERAAFRLSQGEVSEPIAVRNGYMVVQLAEGTVEKFMSEMEFAEKKNKIKKILFDRRADKIANEYVKKIMADKNLQLQPEVFFALSAQLSKIIRDKYSDEPAPVYINDREIAEVERNIDDLKDKTLITHQAGQMTVGEFLAKIDQMPATLRPDLKLSRQLKDAIGVMVRNEYLAAEARKAGLKKSAAAKREIDIQGDEILAAYFIDQIKERISVPDEEIKAYRESAEFGEMAKRAGGKIEDETIIDLLFRGKLVAQKMKAADSLRNIYKTHVDTLAFFKLMKNPEATINYNPAKMAIRELFN